MRIALLAPLVSPIAPPYLRGAQVLLADQAGKAVPQALYFSTVLRDIYDRAGDFYAERGTDYRQEVLKRRKHIGYAR